MRRSQLAFILSAASRVVQDGEILIIGSQAILATYDESVLPDEAVMSVEVDVAYFDDESWSKGGAVDGAMGELSEFHEEFGFYAQGVEIGTATLPAGWQDRLVRVASDSEPPSYARALDAHDLVISKLVAGREKDERFARALVRADLVDVEVLAERAALVPPEQKGPRLDGIIDTLHQLRFTGIGEL